MDNNDFNNQELNGKSHEVKNDSTTTENNADNLADSPFDEYKNPYVQGGRFKSNTTQKQTENLNIYTYNSSGNNYGNNGYNNANDGSNFNGNKPQNNANGLGVASMILGIVSIVLCCTVWISIICSVVGLVLGIVSIVKKRNGFALAGIITASFGLAFSLLIIVLEVVLVNFNFENFPDSVPGNSPGHDFSVKRIMHKLVNFFGKK